MLGTINVCLLCGGAYYLHTQLIPANLPPVLPTLSFPPAATDTIITGATRLPTETPILSPTFTSLPGATETSALPMPAPTLTARPPETILIGHSVAGRPIEVFRFGSGPQGRMIVAGIHGGNEYNTIRLAQELIQHLSEHPEAIPANISIFILPALNPDGEARVHNIFGRANEHGVDLNHNWPVDWHTNWSRKGCWRYLYLSGGTGPASEPETQALLNFLLTQRLDALISYHSAAAGIYPGGAPPDPGSVRLAKALAGVSGYAYPPVPTGCSMTGSMADWVVSQGITAVDIELTDHTRTDFEQNLAILSVLVNWQP